MITGWNTCHGTEYDARTEPMTERTWTCRHCGDITVGTDAPADPCPSCGQAEPQVRDPSPRVSRICACCDSDIPTGSRCPTCGAHYRDARIERDTIAAHDDLEKEYGWFVRHRRGATLLFAIGIAGTAGLAVFGKSHRRVLAAPAAAISAAAGIAAIQRRDQRLEGIGPDEERILRRARRNARHAARKNRRDG